MAAAMKLIDALDAQIIALDAKREGVSIEDFHAYMPQHSYIYAPSREMWPAGSINARLPPISAGEKGHRS